QEFFIHRILLVCKREGRFEYRGGAVFDPRCRTPGSRHVPDEASDFGTRRRLSLGGLMTVLSGCPGNRSLGEMPRLVLRNLRRVRRDRRNSCRPSPPAALVAARGRVGQSCPVRRVFLLSPAQCGGERARLLLRRQAAFALALRLRQGGA